MRKRICNPLGMKDTRVALTFKMKARSLSGSSRQS